MPAVIPCEGTIFQVESATPGTYTTIAAATGIGANEPEVAEVPKTTLASTRKEYRPGKIPDEGTIDFTIWYDPNDATHQSLYTFWAAGTTKNWKVKYNDGLTTNASETFAGFITKPSRGEIADEENVSLTVTIRITGSVTRTAGTP
jgi:hypothetical protein